MVTIFDSSAFTRIKRITNEPKRIFTIPSTSFIDTDGDDIFEMVPDTGYVTNIREIIVQYMYKIEPDKFKESFRQLKVFDMFDHITMHSNKMKTIDIDTDTYSNVLMKSWNVADGRRTISYNTASGTLTALFKLPFPMMMSDEYVIMPLRKEECDQYIFKVIISRRSLRDSGIKIKSSVEDFKRHKTYIEMVNASTSISAQLVCRHTYSDWDAPMNLNTVGASLIERQFWANPTDIRFSMVFEIKSYQYIQNIWLVDKSVMYGQPKGNLKNSIICTYDGDMMTQETDVDHLRVIDLNDVNATEPNHEINGMSISLGPAGLPKKAWGATKGAFDKTLNIKVDVELNALPVNKLRYPFSLLVLSFAYI